MSEVICPSCSTQAEAGAVFCDNCGYDLRSVQPAAPPQAPQPAPPQPVSGVIQCSNCGAENAPGSAFCENCGFQLSGQAPQSAVPPVAPAAPPAVAPPITPPVQPPVAPPVQPPAMSPVVGRFVLQPANTDLPIPPGKTEVVLGREDPVSSVFPEVDLDPHGGQDSGVGRQHCKLVAQGGQVYVEDMNSVNGSFLNKQKLVPGQRMPINNGDELRLGKLVLLYYSS